MTTEQRYWDDVGDEEMGGTTDTTESHLAKIQSGGVFDRFDMRVLEIGCGMGRLIVPLADQYPGAWFIGFDPSFSLLGRFDHLPRNVGRTATLPGERFDYIYSMLVFQHIDSDEKRKYIDYAFDHLNPGGRFRFQFVEGDEPDAPHHHQCYLGDVYDWCKRFPIWESSSDPDHPEWVWVDAQVDS